MTDSRPRRPQDPFDALFDPKVWSRLEKQIIGGIEKTFKGLTIRKEVETLVPATEEAPAKTREVLVATLDVPGVRKEDLAVEFATLDYGFTRLSVTTKRNGETSLYKAEFRETVVADSAVATVDLGVLTVRVPVKEDDTQAKVNVPVS